jgi:hypothetical protein
MTGSLIVIVPARARADWIAIFWLSSAALPEAARAVPEGVPGEHRAAQGD